MQVLLVIQQQTLTVTMKLQLVISHLQVQELINHYVSWVMVTLHKLYGMKETMHQYFSLEHILLTKVQSYTLKQCNLILKLLVFTGIVSSTHFLVVPLERLQDGLQVILHMDLLELLCHIPTTQVS